MIVDELTSATQVQSASGRQYHIGLAPGQVAPNILLVGDPKRAAKVAARLEQCQAPVQSREFLSYRGQYRGIDITVFAHGISAENMEIAVIELCQCIERPNFIRCGSSGALLPEVKLGDLVIARGCVRREQTSSHYVEMGYPALSDHELVCALLEASQASASKDRRNIHLGMSASAGGFYAAQGRSIPPFMSRTPDADQELARQGVLNLEMESSCLLTLASLAKCRAASLCAIFAERHSDRFIGPQEGAQAEEAMIELALEAFRILARLDKERADAPYWHSGHGPA